MNALQEYKCPCCGGAIEFNSRLQKMKCPYCGKEMEKGEIRNKGFNYFLPEGEKPVSFLVDAEKAIEKRNGILLTLYPYGYGGEEYPAAYCCRGCKKIILEYE